MSNTYSCGTLTVPRDVYVAIRELLLNAGYTHTILERGSEVGERINMHGIMLRCEREKV